VLAGDQDVRTRAVYSPLAASKQSLCLDQIQCRQPVSAIAACSSLAKIQAITAQAMHLIKSFNSMQQDQIQSKMDEQLLHIFSVMVLLNSARQQCNQYYRYIHVIQGNPAGI
jgi:chromosome condensin MukBEF ATPase and DNA-binding subunit MukB